MERRDSRVRGRIGWALGAGLLLAAAGPAGAQEQEWNIILLSENANFPRADRQVTAQDLLCAFSREYGGRVPDLDTEIVSQTLGGGMPDGFMASRVGQQRSRGSVDIDGVTVHYYTHKADVMGGSIQAIAILNHDYGWLLDKVIENCLSAGSYAMVEALRERLRDDGGQEAETQAWALRYFGMGLFTRHANHGEGDQVVRDFQRAVSTMDCAAAWDTWDDQEEGKEVGERALGLLPDDVAGDRPFGM